MNFSIDHGGVHMKRWSRVTLAILLAVSSLGRSPLTTEAAPAQLHDTARHLYDRVMEEFKHRDYEAALAGFRFFLEIHGQSALAANAQYWAGECQYRMGRYKDALTAFYNVVSYYPLSPKLAASTLKIGQTYKKLQDHEKARLMFERVIEQYPDSQEAESARTFLEAETAEADPAPRINN
jgi:tol-pal system protein YbgF